MLTNSVHGAIILISLNPSCFNNNNCMYLHNTFNVADILSSAKG